MNAVQLKTMKSNGFIIKFVFTTEDKILKANEDYDKQEEFTVAVTRAIYSHDGSSMIFPIIEGTNGTNIESLTVYWKVDFQIESLSLNDCLGDLIGYLESNELNEYTGLCSIVGLTREDLEKLRNLGVYTIKLIEI